MLEQKATTTSILEEHETTASIIEQQETTIPRRFSIIVKHKQNVSGGLTCQVVSGNQFWHCRLESLPAHFKAVRSNDKEAGEVEEHP